MGHVTLEWQTFCLCHRWYINTTHITTMCLYFVCFYAAAIPKNRQKGLTTELKCQNEFQELADRYRRSVFVSIDHGILQSFWEILLENRLLQSNDCAILQQIRQFRACHWMVFQYYSTLDARCAINQRAKPLHIPRHPICFHFRLHEIHKSRLAPISYRWWW